jgi:hypothetical protein
MNRLPMVVMISAIIGAVLGLDHEYRWFKPFDKSIGFWESKAAGALIWGAVFGICVSIAAISVSKFFARYRNWSRFRVTFTGGVLALMAIGVSALGWDYIDGSEDRWSTGRVTRFQTGFEEETAVETIQGNADTEFKQAILNWYTVASRVASEDVTADAPSVLSASTPEYAEILGGMLDGSRSYDWDRLTWGDPGEPCRGPFGDPVAFRVLSVDDAEGLVKFKPWDPAKGGVFDRDVSIPPQSEEIAVVTVTRQITLLSDADDGTIKYRYACPRSEDAASPVIFVLCRGGGIWRVCGQTDTSGLWIAYPFEAMGEERPVQVAVNELLDGKPFQLAFDETRIWIPNARGEHLLALSLDGHIVRDLVLGGKPVQLTVSGDDIWVGTDEEVIVQIPTDGEPVDHGVPGKVIGLASAEDGIWAVVESNGRRIVGRVSDSGFEPQRKVIAVITGIVSDAERAWVYGPSGLLRVDIDAAYETGISRSLADPIAWGAGAIWARGSAPGYLLRIDPSDGSQSEFKVAGKIAGIGTSSDAVWVGDSEHREVTRVTPTGTISGRWRVNINPEQILFDGDALWVADPDSSMSVVRLPLSLNTP